MLRLEFRWYVWLFALLVVFMIFKGPGTIGTVRGRPCCTASLTVRGALVKGLHGVQDCSHNPCGS